RRTRLASPVWQPLMSNARWTLFAARPASNGKQRRSDGITCPENPQRAMVDSRCCAGGSSVVWATHANPSTSSVSLHNRNQMVAANRELPASGYALEVDGRLKAEFATKDGARAGGEELKKRFPMLQIRIFDAQTNAREEIQIL